MNKSTKGALAATAAGVLLMGGAGSLAFWSDSQDVGSANITSGELDLSAPDCADDLLAGTHGWQIDGGGAFVPGTTKLVPGDSVSKVCDMTLTLTGSHIGADLAIDTAALTDNGATSLDDELAPTATFTVDGAAYAPITAPGTYTVQATVTVGFAGLAATNASQNGDVDLDAINVTATQTHP